MEKYEVPNNIAISFFNHWIKDSPSYFNLGFFVFCFFFLFILRLWRTLESDPLTPLKLFLQSIMGMFGW